MRRLLTCLLAFWGILAAQPGNRLQFVPGQILVQERVGADPQVVSQALARVGGLTGHIPVTRHHVLQVQDRQIDSAIAFLQRTGLFSVVERDGVAYPVGKPNDPDFPSQWYLTTIQAPTAWNTTTGSASQPIALIDSGVDSTHPDFTGRLVPGWNFVLNNSNTSDDYGHGTAVAGTIGAATNNGMGIAGVTWNNPIMPLVVLDSTGYASYSNMASAITYAVQHGARIINISLGGTTSSSTLQSAVNYAWSNGAVVFAAAGNSSSSAPMYPAACNYVVSVSATNPDDSFASFSEYGSWIDLSAPGSNILTTTEGGGYGYWYGTSFASPIAAGVGALALAMQPGLTASALVSLLEQNSDDLGTPGFDDYFGYGRVNAAKAIAAAAAAPPPPKPAPPSVTISSPASGSTVSGTVYITGSASSSAAISMVALYCSGNLVSTTSSASFSLPWNASGASSGSHTLTVTATDTSNNTGSASVAVNVPQPATKDTTPPTVQITTPVNGAFISTSPNTNIAVSASDNVAVAQVSIYIDGVQLYSGTKAPYSVQWNTRKVAAGTHTISATAWDTSGNSASTDIRVTVRSNR